MKNLLLISHSSNKVGGGEDDFLNLLKYLQGKFNIYSIFPDGERAKMFSDLSFKYLVIPGRIFPEYTFNLKKHIAFVYYSIRKIFAMVSFLKENRNINLCYVNSSVCFVEMRVLKYFKIPYVVSVKEIIKPAILRKYVYRLMDKSAKRIIAISGFLKELMRQTVKHKEIKIIRSSINEDIYDKFKNDFILKRNHDKFYILNIGQIYELKNQMLLVEAINMLNNKEKIIAKFIGFEVDKKYKNKLLKKIKEYGLENSIEFLGAINKKEIALEYLNCDAVVITSKREGMSLVLVEALFFEKPVISTAVGIIPEVVINGENGIIVNKKDSASIAHALDALIDDKNFYNKIKNKSSITYKSNFNLQNSLEEHLILFNQCIQE